MKKIVLIFIGLWQILPAYAQDWQQVGDFNDRSPACFYSDTVDEFLYIGGFFLSVGPDTMYGICRWDGQQFYSMGDVHKKQCGNFCNPISMITRYHNEIYIGGTIDTINGENTNGIAKWNGIAWSTVGNNPYPHHPTDYWIFSSYIKDDKLYVTGKFPTAGTDSCNSVAYWDGTDWYGMNFPADIGGYVPKNFSIEFYNGEWYVGGNCYNEIDGQINHDILRYDGVSWKQVGEGLKGGISFINDMIVYKDELYICGYFRSADGNAGNKIMRWDGETWHDVGGGACGDYNLSKMMVYNDKLYVVGIFSCMGNDLPVSNVATWDGERWCSLGNSYFNNTIIAITAWKGDIYVCGGFTEVGGYPVKNFAKYVGDQSATTCTVVAAPEPKETAQLKITPNPALATIDIKGSAQDGVPEFIRVFDMAGRECSAFADLARAGSTIDIHRLPPGLYFVQLQYAHKLAGGRFVKM